MQTSHNYLADDFKTVQLLFSKDKSEVSKAHKLLFSNTDKSKFLLLDLLDSIKIDDSSQKQEAPYIKDLALLLGAFKLRDAITPLIKLYPHYLLESRTQEYVSILAALAEILDGQDAFNEHVSNFLAHTKDNILNNNIIHNKNDRSLHFLIKCFESIGDRQSLEHIQSLTTKLEQQQDLATFENLIKASEQQGGELSMDLRALSSQMASIRQQAIQNLLKTPQQSLPFLLKKLNQGQGKARIAAAQALLSIKSSKNVAPLMVAAKNPPEHPDSAELRPIALRALANSLSGEEFGLLDDLLSLSQDPDIFVQAGALICLGRLPEREGLQVILKALEHNNTFVAESAAIALSEGIRGDDLHILDPLIGLLQTAKSAVVTEALLIALSRVKSESKQQKIALRQKLKIYIQGQTAVIRKLTITLLEDLYSENEVIAIQKIDMLLAALKDAHPEVRLMAAAFLAKHMPQQLSLGAKRLHNALKTALENQEIPCAKLLLQALARHQSLQAQEILQSMTQNKNHQVAIRAAELLEQPNNFIKEWSSPQILSKTSIKKVNKAKEISSRIRRVSSHSEDYEQQNTDNSVQAKF